MSSRSENEDSVTIRTPRNYREAVELLAKVIQQEGNRLLERRTYGSDWTEKSVFIFEQPLGLPKEMLHPFRTYIDRQAYIHLPLIVQELELIKGDAYTWPESPLLDRLEGEERETQQRQAEAQQRQEEEERAAQQRQEARERNERERPVLDLSDVSLDDLQDTNVDTLIYALLERGGVTIVSNEGEYERGGAGIPARTVIANPVLLSPEVRARLKACGAELMDADYPGCPGAVGFIRTPGEYNGHDYSVEGL